MELSRQAFSSVVPNRVFVVCDQDATAPIWGYIIREKGISGDPGDFGTAGDGAIDGRTSGPDRDRRQCAACSKDRTLPEVSQPYFQPDFALPAHE